MNPRDIATLPDDDAGAAADMPSKLGHFEIVGRLGAGGMGLVFEGRDALLGRRVALKLIHPARAGGQVAPARLLREAQALAKLSHPNVVTVFEVGIAGDDPFVAMELVEGVTLQEWMREPREWRAVLDIFIAVGHGLAAVHALGLVHRDFKPSNVLVDSQGVPKLGDFGLVGVVDEMLSAPGISSTSPAVNVDSRSDSTLTQPGSVLGTPAYMAPEQRAGLLVDARADQYSFGKTLREALGASFPPVLEPILARAQALDPDERFPAMSDLLDALARVRRGNRGRWIVAGATVLIVGAVALAWSFGRAQATDDPGCEPPTKKLETVWSAARRGALDTHLAAIDPTYGKQRFGAAATVLDRGGERWLDLEVDACRVSHESRQSGALFDRRVTCLDRALLEIDQTVGVLEGATDAVSLDSAMRAVVGLPTLAECADVAALTEKLPSPTNPLQRTEADAIARETVAIDVAQRAGGTRTGVIARANAAIARARALNHPETLARALRSLAAIQIEDEAGDATLATLREAITVASAAHDDRVVAELWSRLLVALAKYRRGPEGAALVPAAEAALARATAAPELVVEILDGKSQVAGITNETPRAQALLAEAMKILDDNGAATPGSPLAVRRLELEIQSAVLKGYATDWSGMITALRAIVPRTDAVYGPDHPSVMRVHFNIAVALRRLNDNAGALVEFREAARIGETRLAPSPNLAGIIEALGSTLYQMEKFDEAIVYLERALAMSRATMPANDIRLTPPLNDLGSAFVSKNRLAEAAKLFAEEIEIYTKLGHTKEENYAVAIYNLAELDYKTGKCEEAFPLLDRVVEIYKGLGAYYEADVDSTFELVADCQVAMKKWDLGLATVEGVLARGKVDEEVRASLRFVRARAWAGKGDIRRGVDEARAARADMVKSDPATDLTEIDAWLAAH